LGVAQPRRRQQNRCTRSIDVLRRQAARPSLGCAAAGVKRPMTMRKRRRAPPVLLLVFLLGLSPAALVAAERTSTRAYNKQYVFTQDTFTDKISAWTKLLDEFKGKPGVNYLEIGTFEGRSALWVLENILTHPTSTLTIIDAFEENTYERFVSNVDLSGEANKFKILVGLSTHRIRELPFDSIDFAYVDGSGNGIVMLSDLVSTWNLVKVGGLIICSRYSLTPRLRKALRLRAGDPGPHEAIDAFLNLFGPYINVMTFQENYVIVRKLRSAH
jgi:hypothetical protein